MTRHKTRKNKREKLLQIELKIHAVFAHSIQIISGNCVFFNSEFSVIFFCVFPLLFASKQLGKAQSVQLKRSWEMIRREVAELISESSGFSLSLVSRLIAKLAYPGLVVDACKQMSQFQPP